MGQKFGFQNDHLQNLNMKQMLANIELYNKNKF